MKNIAAMGYNETVEFLFSQLPAYHRVGKAAYKNDLETTLALDRFDNHPHRKYKTIHIAGTNGKGSLSHLTVSVLMEAGFRTGLYTSPHLRDFRERIKVNGRMMPRNAVVKYVREHAGVIDSLKPSFFEMTAAMAFSYFAAAEVDVAVIETGLGGRLDSTNIIRPVLSVITNIGHDHMDLLGGTLEKVAAEKAGIIKNNTPVVISETQVETERIFLEKASETGSEISFADSRFSCMPEGYNALGNSRRYLISELSSGKSVRVRMPLAGDYQAKNLQALFQIFRSLPGFKVSEADIVRGARRVIRNTGLMGRWQVLGRNPLTICDTGHNKEGLEYVLRQLGNVPKKKLHMVLGFVADKDVSSLLSLMPRDADYYFTKASVPRALDENLLLRKAVEAGLSGRSYPDVGSALRAAKENAGESDLIFIGGSTFVVAEVL
jgi:dihydrofolate synthase/folylpolyglutamate synthase